MYLFRFSSYYWDYVTRETFNFPPMPIFPIDLATIYDKHDDNIFSIVAFVPKITCTTEMYGKYVAIKELLKQLPVECVELISKHLGGPFNLTKDFHHYLLILLIINLVLWYLLLLLSRSL
jgi:hypothetical protein